MQSKLSMNYSVSWVCYLNANSCVLSESLGIQTAMREKLQKTLAEQESQLDDLNKQVKVCDGGLIGSFNTSRSCNGKKENIRISQLQPVLKIARS